MASVCPICNKRKGSIPRDGKKICFECNKEIIQSQAKANPVPEKKVEKPFAERLQEAIQTNIAFLKERGAINADENILCVVHGFTVVSKERGLLAKMWLTGKTGSRLSTLSTLWFGHDIDHKHVKVEVFLFASDFRLTILILNHAVTSWTFDKIHLKAQTNDAMTLSIESDDLLVEGITTPESLRDFLALLRTKQASGTPQVQNIVESIPDQIKKLHDLHTQGILTSEEFQSKKASLLAKM